MEETIFNFIDSVLFNKRKLNSINEGETQFNLYMVNRWCSMYSPDISQIINETANRYSQTFLNKQEQYDFIFNLYPKVKKRRIEYFKKNKERDKEEKEDDEDILLAKSMELSVREIKLYKELIL